MIHPKQSITRRAFLRRAATGAGAFSLVPGRVLGLGGATPPSQKLNLAFVGIGGRGETNLEALAGENVVALCDVDDRRAAASFRKHPGARRFTDYRRMLDQLHRQLDGVVISTPDHTHAVIALAAMRRGKHVYCEKPLAHSIGEIRALMQAARRFKVSTQLGNQGHSFDTIRNFCEWIWDGAIGRTHTVHAFCGSNNSRIDQLPLLAEPHPMPAGLDWDQWLGPARFRPYHPAYLPGSWRAWTPFGNGTVGDWTCHVVDPVFWALDLGAPVAVSAQVTNYDPRQHADTFPPGAVITYEFPAKANRGPLKLVWFDGTEKPPRPAELEADDTLPKIGAVVMGDRGTIIYGSHGATGPRLIPDAKMDAYKKPPKTLWRTTAHHEDWLNAIRTGKPAGSNFDYGGPLSELAMLGIIAMRLPGTRLEWDGARARFKNSAAANAFVAPRYREGWKL